MMWLLLLLSLSFLIVLHEWGHYITARMFKVRVERFYLFFDPWFSIAKKKIGDTVWGIGWLPLGGYCKMAGMIDESMDKSFIGKEPEPYEFRAKPAWQRLIIMLGGIVVNMVVAWMIYSALLFNNGESYLRPENVKYGIAVSELGERHGFKNGDKIIAVDGKEIMDFNDRDILMDMVLNQRKEVSIVRDNKSMNLELTTEFYKEFLEEKQQPFGINIPNVITGFTKNIGLESSGAKVGDRIMQVNGSPTLTADQMTEVLATFKPGEEVIIQLDRDGSPVQVKSEISDAGTLGFERVPTEIFEITRVEYSLLESIPAGLKKTWTTLGDYVKNFKIIFNKDLKGWKQVGGLGTFAKLFKGVDSAQFWNNTALISVILAFMNLLPIPALDGGHAMFCIWEMVTGRKPNDKFLEIVQIVGFFLVLALIIYANGLDVVRAFFEK